MDITAGLPKTSSNRVISVVDCFDVLMKNTVLAILSSQSEWSKLKNAASVEAMELFILSTRCFCMLCRSLYMFYFPFITESGNSKGGEALPFVGYYSSWRSMM
jgi:hypothetical protein